MMPLLEVPCMQENAKGYESWSLEDLIVELLKLRDGQLPKQQTQATEVAKLLGPTIKLLAKSVMAQQARSWSTSSREEFVDQASGLIIMKVLQDKFDVNRGTRFMPWCRQVLKNEA